MQSVDDDRGYIINDTDFRRHAPNQDTMPKGGFGNLIALPLQKRPRENGCSVFVDAELRPFDDQSAFLTSIQPMAPHDIELTILRATGGTHPLDVTFIDEEDMAKPWQRSMPVANKLSGPSMPESLTVTLANLIYFEKAQLPQTLANRLSTQAIPRCCGCGTSADADTRPWGIESTNDP